MLDVKHAPKDEVLGAVRNYGHGNYLGSGWKRFLVATVCCFLLFPKLIGYVLSVGILFGLGYLFGQFNRTSLDHVVNKMADRGLEVFSRDSTADHVNETQSRVIDFVSRRFGRTKENPVVYRAGIATNIDCALNYFLDFMIRDFINGWYKNINHSESPQFAEQVRTSMNIVFHQFNYLARSSSFVGLTMLLSQTVVLHLREYRKFEVSGTSFESFVAANPRSPLALAVTRPQLLKNLRSIAHHMVQHLVPKEDVTSPLTFSLLVELVSSCVLQPVVELLSDPDWINQMLIKKLGQGDSSSGRDGDKAGGEPSAGPTSIQDRSRSRISRALNSHQKMHLKLIEGKHFRYMGRGNAGVVPSSTSFYCYVMCGHERASSKKIRGEANPMWMQEWHFSMDRIESLNDSKTRGYVDGIVVDVYESKTLSLKDKLLGSVYIQLANLKPNTYHKGWYSIEQSTNTKEVDEGNGMQLLMECMLIQSDPLDADGTSDASCAITTENYEEELLDESAKRNRDRIIVQNLPLRTLHKDGTLLIQFMQYMDDQHADNLLKFYLNLETFQLYASDPSATKDIQRKDALDHYEQFFKEGSKSNILRYMPESAKGVVASLPKKIEQSVSAFVFVEVSNIVEQVIERDYWSSFKESSLFSCWWEDARSQYLPEGNSAADVSPTHAVADLPKVDQSASFPRYIATRTVSQVKSLYRLSEFNGKGVDDLLAFVVRERQVGLKSMSAHESVLRRRCISDSTLLMLPDIQRVRLAAGDSSGTESEVGSDEFTDPELLLSTTGLVRVDFRRAKELARKRRAEVNFKKLVEDAQAEHGGMHFLNSQLTNLREQINILDDILEQRKEANLAANLHADSVFLAGGSHVNPVGTSPVHPTVLSRANQAGPKHLSSSQIRKMRVELIAQTGQIEKMLREMAQEQDLHVHLQRQLLSRREPRDSADYSGLNEGEETRLAPNSSNISIATSESFHLTSTSLLNINLHDVQVEVTESGITQSNGKFDSSGSLASLYDSINDSDVHRATKERLPLEAVYLVQILSTRTGKGWIKQKTFSQFCSLHDLLRPQFPKVDKIPFPPFSSGKNNSLPSPTPVSPMENATSLPLSSGLASITNRAVKGFGKVVDSLMRIDEVTSGASSRQSVDGVLDSGRPQKVLGTGHSKIFTSYLTMLCMDMVLAESRDLKFFLKPESIVGSVNSESTSQLPLPSTAAHEDLDGATPSSASTTAMVESQPPPRNSSMRVDTERLKVKRIDSEPASPEFQPLPQTSAAASLVKESSPKSPQKSSVLPSPREPSTETFIETLAESLKEPSPARETQTAKPLNNLDAADIDILLECGFSLVEEIFGLVDEVEEKSIGDLFSGGGGLFMSNFTGSNNWLRLKGLTLIKQVVRRTQGTAISNIVIDKMADYTSDTSVTKLIDWLTSTLWPGDGKHLVKRIPPRPLDVQERDRLHAKQLWLKTVQQGNFGNDFATKVIGRYNTMVGMTRLFNMLQTREINRHLVIVIVERIIKSILLQNPSSR